jgi:hypothetical protein
MPTITEQQDQQRSDVSVDNSPKKQLIRSPKFTPTPVHSRNPFDQRTTTSTTTTPRLRLSLRDSTSKDDDTMLQQVRVCVCVCTYLFIISRL